MILSTRSGSCWHSPPAGPGSWPRLPGWPATVAWSPTRSHASVLAAFGPSQYLRFSPLARSTDQGSSWTPAPARRCGAGARRPGPGKRRVAGPARHGGRYRLGEHRESRGMEAGRPPPGRWPVSRASPVADRGPDGGDDRRRRQSGRGGFVRPGRAGGAVRPVIHRMDGGGTGRSRCRGADRSDPPRPARRREPPPWSAPAEAPAPSCSPCGAPTACARGRSRRACRWTAPSWSRPAKPAQVASSSASRASGFAPTASVITPSVTQWQPLPALPSGTTSVAATPTGGFDALVPSQSVLSVYGLGSLGWARVQRLRVDIQYGSSG